MNDSIKNYVSAVLFDAAAAALSAVGLKNTNTIARDIAANIYDDASDQYDQRSLDCSFYCMVKAVAGYSATLAAGYALATAAHDAADKAAADAKAAADKSAKVADLKKQLAALGA